MQRRALLLGTAIAGATVAAGVAGFAVSELLTVRDPIRSTDRGATGTPLIGGPFRLTNHLGVRMTEADLLGRFSLLYFGFTFCPDVCPTGLQTMADALDILGGAAGDVTPVFITIDPERDTPATLAPYVRHFHDRLVGLTGTAEEVAQVARSFRVYYRKAQLAADGSYLMDHSSVIFLMDRDFRFATHFTHESKPDQIAAAIRQRFTS
jgi:protein SCO1/2